MGEQPSVLSLCVYPSLAQGKGLLSPAEESSILSIIGEIALASGKRLSAVRGPVVTSGETMLASVTGSSLPRVPSILSVGGFASASPSDGNGLSGVLPWLAGVTLTGFLFLVRFISSFFPVLKTLILCSRFPKPGA